MLPPPTPSAPADDEHGLRHDAGAHLGAGRRLGRLLARDRRRPEVRPDRREPVRPRASRSTSPASSCRRRVFLARLGARRLRAAGRAERDLPLQRRRRTTRRPTSRSSAGRPTSSSARPRSTSPARASPAPPSTVAGSAVDGRRGRALRGDDRGGRRRQHGRRSSRPTPPATRRRGERTFAYMPDQQSVVAFDPSDPTDRAPAISSPTATSSRSAARRPRTAEIEVRAGDAVRAAAATGADGAFRLNVPLAADEETFDFAVIASVGLHDDRGFRGDDRPRSAGDRASTRSCRGLTAEASLRVAGRTEPDAKLTLNGRADRRSPTAASTRPSRSQPGDNRIELIATDAVGNVTVEKSTVKLDQDPPLLVSSDGGAGRPTAASRCWRSRSSPRTPRASPRRRRSWSSPARRTTPGYLRYNKAAKTYQGSSSSPKPTSPEPSSAGSSSSDDAGNGKTSISHENSDRTARHQLMRSRRKDRASPCRAGDRRRGSSPPPPAGGPRKSRSSSTTARSPRRGRATTTTTRRSISASRRRRRASSMSGSSIRDTINSTFFDKMDRPGDDADALHRLRRRRRLRPGALRSRGAHRGGTERRHQARREDLWPRPEDRRRVGDPRRARSGRKASASATASSSASSSTRSPASTATSSTSRSA